MASPCVVSDLMAGREMSFSRSAPWQAGHFGAPVVGNTSASNSLPQLLQAYSKIGMDGSYSDPRSPIPDPQSLIPDPQCRVIFAPLGEAFDARCTSSRIG